MGSSFSSFVQAPLEAFANFWARPCRVIVLGLDGAGKTTLLYRLKLGETVTTIPTIGFNVETFRYKSILFTAWDIGGQRQHAIWRHYYQGTDAVIFVVDAADRVRMAEAAEELRYVFMNDELRDCKLLVYANKQDHPDCMPLPELREKMQLDRVTRNPKHIQQTVAVSGEGVYEGLTWLSKAIMAPN